MTYEMYSVKDELTNRFNAPIMMLNDDEAKRAFKSQVNNIQIWKDNPSDFSLYKVGTFCEETGEIIYKPEKLAGGRSVLDA